MCYLICTVLIKISILLFYRRLTSSLTNKFVYSVWACITICVLYFITFAIVTFFTCSVSGKTTNCAEAGPALVAVTSISTAQDLIICLLPAFLIYNLQMPKRQKIALGCIFGLGLVTTFCGIMRVYYATYIYYSTYDVTWYGYYGWVWSAIEADLGLICASAPALRALFRHSLGLRSARTGDSGPNSRNPPILEQATSPKRSILSNKNRKNSEAGSDEDQYHLQSISLERDLHGTGLESDDISQRSGVSTENLTTAAQMPSQGFCAN